MSVIIRTRPGPYQVVFISMALVAGLILILRGRAVGVSTQPPWVSYLLAGSLVLGAGTTLLGVVLPNLLGTMLERSGQWMLVILLSVYSGVIIGFEGPRATVTVVFFAAYVVAGVWRIVQIHRTVRETVEKIQAETARLEDTQ